MQLSALDIEAEHQAALDSLSPSQRRALERLALAERRSWQCGDSVEDHLGLLFAAEAIVRVRAAANDR
jgi:hypothetical protein